MYICKYILPDNLSVPPVCYGCRVALRVGCHYVAVTLRLRFTFVVVTFVARYVYYVTRNSLIHFTVIYVGLFPLRWLPLPLLVCYLPFVLVCCWLFDSFVGRCCLLRYVTYYHVLRVRYRLRCYLLLRLVLVLHGFLRCGWFVSSVQFFLQLFAHMVLVSSLFAHAFTAAFSFIHYLRAFCGYRYRYRLRRVLRAQFIYVGSFGCLYVPALRNVDYRATVAVLVPGLLVPMPPPAVLRSAIQHGFNVPADADDLQFAFPVAPVRVLVCVWFVRFWFAARAVLTPRFDCLPLPRSYVVRHGLVRFLRFAFRACRFALRCWLPLPFSFRRAFTVDAPLPLRFGCCMVRFWRGALPGVGIASFWFRLVTRRRPLPLVMLLPFTWF